VLAQGYLSENQHFHHTRASCLLVAGLPKFNVNVSMKRYIGQDGPVVEHLNFLSCPVRYC